MSDAVPRFSTHCFAEEPHTNGNLILGFMHSYGCTVYSEDALNMVHDAMQKGNPLVVVPVVYKYGLYKGPQEHIVDLENMTAQLRGTLRTYQLTHLAPVRSSKTGAEPVAE